MYKSHGQGQLTWLVSHSLYGEKLEDWGQGKRKNCVDGLMGEAM